MASVSNSQLGGTWNWDLEKIVRILDEEIQLKENIKASFRLYWYLWLILLVTAYFDFVTTVLFMDQDGIQLERNFIVRWLAFSIGILPGVFLGKFLQILAAIVFSALSLRLARATLLLMHFLNLVAVIINFL